MANQNAPSDDFDLAPRLLNFFMLNSADIY